MLFGCSSTFLAPQQIIVRVYAFLSQQGPEILRMSSKKNNYQNVLDSNSVTYLFCYHQPSSHCKYTTHLQKIAITALGTTFTPI